MAAASPSCSPTAAPSPTATPRRCAETTSSSTQCSASTAQPRKAGAVREKGISARFSRVADRAYWSPSRSGTTHAPAACVGGAAPLRSRSAVGRGKSSKPGTRPVPVEALAFTGCSPAAPIRRPPSAVSHKLLSGKQKSSSLGTARTATSGVEEQSQPLGSGSPSLGVGQWVSVTAAPAIPRVRARVPVRPRELGWSRSERGGLDVIGRRCGCKFASSSTGRRGVTVLRGRLIGGSSFE